MATILPLPDLDDPNIYLEIDRSRAGTRLFDLPGQCRRAWEIAMAWSPPILPAPPRIVVIAGMGGSAIAGDLLRALAERWASVPVWVHRDYGLPAFASGNALVIASSYSGDTEETLSAAEEAWRRGATLVAVTTGGELERRAQDWGIPVLRFDYPAQPREALGYSFLLLLGVLVRLQLFPDPTPQVEEAVSLLEELLLEVRPETPEERNPAKELARWLHGHLPFISGSGLLAPVARRWKGQLNENSKSWAIFEELPEMDHNVVAGTAHPPRLASNIRAVLLTSDADHPRNRLRTTITRQILEESGTPCRTVAGRGCSALAQILTTVLLGDATSYYLAMLYRADPTSIPAIRVLKEALAASP
ncbi:MAG: bifunctional phosphoglucose/phosphomannose isomerase [Chloroflexia bacterium]